MFCRKCGEQISDNCEVCPICGEDQGITITTEKVEKGGNGRAGQMAVKILKKSGKVIGTVVGTVVTSIVVPIVSEEVGKGVQKKVKKGTSDFLKAIKLKKKTPLDKVGEAFKRMQEKARN